MPISPVNYIARPFVSDGRIGDLLRRRGDMAANALMRGGEIQAQMWSRLGQIGQGAVNDYVTEKREAPIRADEARMRGLRLQEAERQAGEPGRLAAQDQALGSAIVQALDAPGEVDPRPFVSIAGPKRGIEVATGVHELRKLTKGPVESPFQSAGRIGAAMKALPPSLQAGFWPKAQEALKATGLTDIPDTFTPDMADFLIAYGSGRAPDRPTRQKVERRNADGSTTIEFVDPQTAGPMTSAPEAEKPDTRSLEVQLADALRRGDTEAASVIQRAMRAGRAPEKATKPSYEWAFDPKTGKNVYVTPDEIRAGGFQKPTGSQRPASGMEKRAMGFFNRARQADIDLEGLEAEVQKMGLPGQVRMAAAPNFLQSQTGQQYTQAQRAFTEARLRKDSGAAIPEQEFANDRQTYFAQPGDSQETLEQKRRARAAVLASLGTEAGQALAEYEGDGETATALVQGYKSRAAKPGGTADADGWTVIDGVKIRRKGR